MVGRRIKCCDFGCSHWLGVRGVLITDVLLWQVFFFLPVTESTRGFLYFFLFFTLASHTLIAFHLASMTLKQFTARVVRPYAPALRKSATLSAFRAFASKLFFYP